MSETPQLPVKPQEPKMDPKKYKGEAHEYNATRLKRPIVSRYTK